MNRASLMLLAGLTVAVLLAFSAVVLGIKGIEIGGMNSVTLYAFAFTLAGAAVAISRQVWIHREPLAPMLLARPHSPRTRLVLRGSAVILLLLTCSFAVVNAPPLPADGDLALVREDGKARIVVPLANRGIAYCERSDDNWNSDWQLPLVQRNWLTFDSRDTFASVYHGLEVLGRNGDQLYFTYRDNKGRWRTETLLDSGVRGHPSFIQIPRPDRTLILAGFVPGVRGGVDIYERLDTTASQDWKPPSALLPPQVGLVDAVTVVDTGDEHLEAVLRIGSHLYEMSRNPSNTKGDLSRGWSGPQSLRVVAGGQPDAVGDPRLILDVRGIVASSKRLQLAVPVRSGLRLLTAGTVTANQWTEQSLPVDRPPDSVALLNGTTNGRPTLEVVYRVGTNISQTWEQEGGSWLPPRKLLCDR
jgi:hypothetical protein